MVEDVWPKLDIVLKKLVAMETKLDNLGSYVKNLDAKVNALISVLINKAFCYLCPPLQEVLNADILVR